MRKMIVLLCTCISFLYVHAQNKTVTGKVSDVSGVPIEGASVKLKGTNTGTLTDSSGNFSLPVPVSVTTLVISSLNFIDKEVAVSDYVEVTLTASNGNLSEVVVVAYGTQRKTNLTGSIGTVRAADVENKPFSSVDKALQGAVAGLQSSSPSGAPGSATSIRIRGVGSLSANANPLWVIDGVVATTGDLTSNTTTANVLSSLNPDDIESISVLKDAAASSIYGSRAANGVIIVTTKSGKAGKTRFNFSTEIGSNKVAFKNKNNRSLTTAESQKLLREALINDGDATNAEEADAIITDPVNGFGLKPNVNTNWFDLVTRTGNQAQYNLSLSGGNEKTQFYSSAGLFKQDGTTIATDFKRYNGSLSLTHKATDRIKFSVGLNGSTSKQQTPLNTGNFGNPVLASYFLLPWYSPYNADGSFKYNDDENQFSVNGGIFNPIIQAAWNKNAARTTAFRGYVSGEYQLINNLTFTSRYSAEYFDIQEDQYRNPFYGDGYALGGDAFASYRKVFDWTWSNFADYRYNITKDKEIYFDVKLGYEAQRYQTYLLQAAGQAFPATLALEYLASAATPTTAYSLPSENTTKSIFSTADINFKDRYVITGSFRRDGSSVFGVNNKYGNFYSVGGTWNVNEESFIKSTDFINLLKLRASYGENGNQSGIPFYSSLATYGYGYNYIGLPGSAPNNVGDSNLTWEKNKIFNVGLDFGFFKNRLTGTVEIYNRKTTALLLFVPLSRTSGFTGQNKNVGAVENKGIEITLSGKPIVTKGFTWDITANFAHNKNKVTALYQDKPVAAVQFNYTVGYDAQTYYLRQWAGVDPANGDPLWYTDGTHNKTTNNISEATFSLYRSAAPKFYGSVINTFSYKGISLQAQFFYNFGNYLYDQWGSYQNSDGLYLGSFNQLSSQLTSWKKAGDITNVPKIIYGGNQNSYRSSTRYLYKGDYIRLRDAQLNYAFPQFLTKKAHVSSLVIYVRGTNLFSFKTDKNLPFDPEQGIDATGDLNVFIARTITGGLKIGL